MNYRINDIVKIKVGGRIVMGHIKSIYKIRPENKLFANIILCGSKKVSKTYGGISNHYFNYSAFPTETICCDDIISVVSRRRGKSYKKRYRIKFIDNNGDVIDEG